MKAHTRHLLQDELNGTTNALMDKFRVRLDMIDPVTKEPRFGPKMKAKVVLLLQRFEDVRAAVETTGIVAQVEDQVARAAADQEEARGWELRHQQEAQEAEAARVRALEAEQVRAAQEEQARLAAEQAKKQQRTAELAVLAQQKREERERARVEQAKKLEEEKIRLEQLNTAIPLGKEGLEKALAMLRESTGSEAQYHLSLEKLTAVVQNICASPESVAFRHIPKDNANFHADLGQFHGGHQSLLALGFREIEQEEGKTVFTLEEPDLASDLDAWSDWFDNLKAMAEWLQAQL
uniref:PUB domain-containing protein n=1 Tax=Globisporangium ultimum (strain ATCC 200006 / CBS 805.95 / DAOM BR144) TaxID=431595 RepID=K3WMN8_GLOUD